MDISSGVDRSLDLRGLELPLPSDPAASNHEHLNTQQKKALAEIDGLLVVLKYLKKVEPTSTFQSRGGPGEAIFSNGGQAANSLDEEPARCNFGLRERALRAPPLSTNSLKAYENGIAEALDESISSIHESTDRAKFQWAALLDIRGAMERYFDRFNVVCCLPELDTPLIRDLWRSYRNASGMQERGILAFRDLVCGENPRDLKSIFAFATLSYAISELLVKWGHMGENRILDELIILRDVLQSPEERSAFNILAMRLWPESENILRSFPENPGHRESPPHASDVGASTGSQLPFSASECSTAMNRTISESLHTTTQDRQDDRELFEDLDFDSFINWDEGFEISSLQTSPNPPVLQSTRMRQTNELSDLAEQDSSSYTFKSFGSIGDPEPSTSSPSLKAANQPLSEKMQTGICSVTQHEDVTDELCLKLDESLLSCLSRTRSFRAFRTFVDCESMNAHESRNSTSRTRLIVMHRKAWKRGYQVFSSSSPVEAFTRRSRRAALARLATSLHL